MRKLVLSATLASLMIGVTASASSNTRFSETITLPADASSLNIEIMFSEDMAHRADNLPKKLNDRSGARSSRDGFRGNGHYGQRDLDRLQERLEEDLAQEFEKHGVSVADTSPYTFKVTIIDAKPSQPTLRQMTKQPSLSYSSIGLGGATLQGELISASGESLGTVDYGWYEGDLRHSFAVGTWSDTHRTFDRFALRTAKALRD